MDLDGRWLAGCGNPGILLGFPGIPTKKKVNGHIHIQELPSLRDRTQSTYPGVTVFYSFRAP